MLCTPNLSDLEKVITFSAFYKYHAKPINELGCIYIMPFCSKNRYKCSSIMKGWRRYEIINDKNISKTQTMHYTFLCLLLSSFLTVSWRVDCLKLARKLWLNRAASYVAFTYACPIRNILYWCVKTNKNVITRLDVVLWLRYIYCDY